MRAQSVAHDGFRGGLGGRTDPHLSRWVLPPQPALLLVPCLSPPWLLPSVLSLRNHPGHRAAALEQQRVRGRERASHERKACEQAWRRASEGGGRAQRWGLGGGARWADEQDEHTARRP